MSQIWSSTICNLQVAIGNFVRLQDKTGSAHYGKITEIEENMRNTQMIVTIKVKTGWIRFEENDITNLEILKSLPKGY